MTCDSLLKTKPLMLILKLSLMIGGLVIPIRPATVRIALTLRNNRARVFN
jgi:hypothetical protein